MGSEVDWTNVLVALIAGLPAIIAAVGAILIRRQLKTPSGDPIGKQVEQANHLAAANVGLTTAVHRVLTDANGTTTPAVPATEET